MLLSRRDILKACCASATIVFAGSARAEGRIPKIAECLELETSNTFPLGVSAGDVSSERAILSTCFTSARVLKLGVWQADSNLLETPLIWADAYALDGGFVHMDATRLKPYTRYCYAFFEPMGRSRIGHFRTAPTDDMIVPLTLGAVSCTSNEHEPVVLEHAGARDDLDLFLLLGDSSYNDGCQTLKEFRARWAQNLSKRGYMDLRASTSIIATLDDHEITDNFDPETTPLSVSRAALRAFFDFTPTRADGTNRIWRTFKWGQTCEIFVMDCRTERLPSTRKKSMQRYISAEQMDWLKNGLLNSKALFKVIMNSVPITAFPFPYESDRWEGYPAQRLEILSFIDNNSIEGVLWLSGDFHFASVGRVSLLGPGSTQTEILAGPGAQVPNPLGLSLNASRQFDWASLRNNYVTLEFSPRNYELKLVYLGGDEDPRRTRLGGISEIHSQYIRYGEAKGGTQLMIP